MDEFMKHNFTVTDTVISGYVEAWTGKKAYTDRQSHGLSINLSAKKEYIFDGGHVVTTGQNDIVYLPKGSSYTVKKEQLGDCYFINFELCGDESFEPFSFRPKNPVWFINEFKEAVKLHTGRKTGFEMREKAILYSILAAMQSEYASKYFPTKTAKMIEPAVEYIHENYQGGEIKTSELAEMCSVSEDYLRKIFRSVYGISPIKYINQLKINYAKELILSGMYTVTEAAQLSGYADMSYFCREFKKYFGISPTEYKKSAD